MNADVHLGQDNPLPLTCTLGPGDGRSRWMRWQRLHEAAGPVVSHFDQGRLEIQYQPGPTVAAELADLVAAEQLCCSFATWSVSEVDGCPVLRVVSRGDEPDAVAPIAALFGVDSTT